jgi:hypothetical protein
MSTKVKSYANGNVVLMAHNLGITDPSKPGAGKIKGCLGFAITRIDVETGKETVLTSKVPFKGETNTAWNDLPTTVAPIQKPVWKDFTAPRNRRLKYRWTPLGGTPANLVPMTELAVTSNEVICNGELDDEVTVEFNNGFLSTQWMARKAPKLADGNFDFPTLLGWLSDPTNPVAIQQGGYLLDLLMSAIKQARAEGGKVYLVLYELAHPALLDLIIANKDVVHIILSNTGPDDETNKAGRVRLHEAGVDITDRFVAADEIGHNKYVVYVDAQGNTVYIVAGTTNWTVTGVTCQNNVGLKIVSGPLARIFLGEYDLLKADSKLTPVQGVDLRKRNSVQPPIVVLKSGARVQAFFAPNTKGRSKPKTPHPLPVDRAYGEMVLRNAEEMAAGAFFIPGTPSYLDAFRWLKANKALKVLKVSVSAIMALMKGDTLLVRTNGERPVAVVANALDKGIGDEIAEFEKLPDAHAIIHLKVFCVDARHPNRWKVVVSIASHNGGDKASFQNDDNTIFIWGHRGLAIAVMVAMFDIWDHYWFRTQVDFNMKGDVFQGYLATDDSWMDKYTVSDASTLKELVYLTQDVVEDDSAPLPDFLQEDPDPQAIEKWINGTYTNPHQVQPISQTDWVLGEDTASGTAGDGQTQESYTTAGGKPEGGGGHKPEGDGTRKPAGEGEHKLEGGGTERKPHEVPAVAGGVSVEKVESVEQSEPAQAGSNCGTDRPMHPVKRIWCHVLRTIKSAVGRK